MSDLISRQDAITLPVMPKEHREYQTYNLDDAYEQGWFDCQKSIEELPSAQRTGEWEELGENKDGTHNIRCNQCGEAFKSKGHAKSYYTRRKYRFCPFCGSDMRGAQDG